MVFIYKLNIVLLSTIFRHQVSTIVKQVDLNVNYIYPNFFLNRRKQAMIISYLSLILVEFLLNRNFVSSLLFISTELFRLFFEKKIYYFLVEKQQKILLRIYTFLGGDINLVVFENYSILQYCIFKKYFDMVKTIITFHEIDFNYKENVNGNLKFLFLKI